MIQPIDGAYFLTSFFIWTTTALLLIIGGWVAWGIYKISTDF